MSSAHNLTPGRERATILLLAAIQFTHILDFVLMMPLGPRLMDYFTIGTSEFSLLVSSYTFSAGLFGLLIGFFLDRFERKRVLLLLYTGFTIGTLACGLSPNYETLLLARILTGIFGGVLTAVTFSIIGDIIPYERRGAATGALMAAFSVASVIGVPSGLYFATLWDWHAPFFILAGTSGIVLVFVWIYLIRIQPQTGPDRPRLMETVRTVLTDKNHQQAYLLMAVMMLAGFTVIPFIAPYLVFNTGMTNAELPWVYFTGGAVTFFSSQWVGRLSDRMGKPKVFTVFALISVVPIVAITVLPPVHLLVILTVTIIFFITVNGRIVPAMAMITGSANPAQRGSFMAINSCIQHLTSGLGAFLSGLIVTTLPDGKLANYGWVGLFAAVMTFIAVYIGNKMTVRG